MSRPSDLCPGHSRTIIGVEELQSGSLQLLLFDPSSSKKHMQQFVHGINANLMKSIRRPLHSMRAKQYQIVAVTGILSDADYEVGGWVGLIGTCAW